MSSTSPMWIRTIPRLVQLAMALSLLLALAVPLIDAGGRGALAASSGTAGTVNGTADPSASGPAELPPVDQEGEPPVEPEPSLDEVPSLEEVPSLDAGEPSLEPSEDPSPSAEPSGNGTIELAVWGCPASVLDATNSDDLPMLCTDPVNGVSVTLDPPGTTGQTGPPEPDGMVRFTGLMAGEYELQATLPVGYQSALPVACGPAALPATDEARLIEVVVSPVTVGLDETVSCDWYLVEEGTDPAITISKWECPAGYDFRDPDSDPEMDCTTPLDGIDFLLERTDPTTASQTITTDPGGLVVVDQLEPGSWQLSEVASEEFPAGATGFRYCTDFGFGQPGYEETAVEDVFTFAVEEGETFEGVCRWYNIPGQDASGSPSANGSASDDPSASASAPTTTTDPAISITKWECQAGYDYTDPDSDPEMDCTTPLEGVDFLVERSAPTAESITITTDANGAATLDSIEPGTWNLSEIPSTDYPAGAEGFRYCTDFGFGQPGYESTPVGEPFTFEVEEGETFEGVCRWYNIPDQVGTVDTDNSVTIQKWTCPPLPSDAPNTTNLELTCTEELGGITFDLNQTDPMPTGQVATTGDDGIATFTGVGPGSWTLTERPTSSFAVSEQAWFSCSGADGLPAGYVSTPVGSPYPFEIPDDTRYAITCDVYNVSVGTAINVFKWVCPVGYDYTAAGTNPVLDCSGAVDGIAFRLAQTAPTTSETTFVTGTFQPGAARFEELQSGSYDLTELASPYQPAGFYRCYDYLEEPGDFAPITVGQPYQFSIEGEVFQGVCHFYNIPWDNGITVHKWSCPVGYEVTQETDPYADCTEVANGVEFTVSQAEVSLTGASGNDGPGRVDFDGLGPGEWTITETPPAGYMGVLIGTCYPEGDTPDGTYITYGMDETWSVPVQIAEGESSRWVCHFFNIYSDDPGTVYIYKWTCPAGYDYAAWGADPEMDCTDVTNGVQFNAEGPDGYASQTDTGDSIDGAVMFGGIEPGEYVFTETLPPDTAYVFITRCTGTSVDAVQPYPLQVGNPLTVQVNPGDEITCHWYNVPYDPYGTIIVTKYLCSTYTYTSAVNCEIYEGGVVFDLLVVEDGDPEPLTDGSTGPNGRLTFADIDPGTYLVHEQDGKPCYISSTMVEDGYISVVEGQTTYVNVYNCKQPPASGSPSGKPKPSNQPPGKYPNTGVEPGTIAQGPVMVAGSEESPEPDNSDGPGPGDGSGAGDGSGPGDGNGRASTAAEAGCPVATSPNDQIDPSPSPDSDEPSAESPSPSAQEVTAASLAPTPDPADAPECERGELPVHIAIEDADVDHDLEYLETVDGEMQEPTGADDASWYLETSRLGEDGPMVISGHLNWWNIPEGPFYAIAELEPGAIIEVTGEDGGLYRYEVRSVSQAASDSSPSDVFDSVQDQLGGETLVLITCGGEWDTSTAEYNQRTVVVAVRIPADADAG